MRVRFVGALLIVLLSANVASAMTYEWRRARTGGTKCYRVTPEGRAIFLADDDICRRSQGSYFKLINTQRGVRCYEFAPNGGVIGIVESSHCE